MFLDFEVAKNVPLISLLPDKFFHVLKPINTDILYLKKTKQIVISYAYLKGMSLQFVLPSDSNKTKK